MPSSEIATVATQAGTLALWRASAFADVDGYDAWEERVSDRLGQAIRSGELVPIGIQGDGAFGVRVAVTPDGATAREAHYTVVTSEPYLLVSDGGPVRLSGIEAVGDLQSAQTSITLPAGRHAVRAAILAWDEEPGSLGPDGRPGPDALADFLVTIVPSDGTEAFRTSEITFDPPE